MSDYSNDTIDHVLRIHSGLESLEHKLNYCKRDLSSVELYAVGALHCNGITFSNYGGNENFITDGLSKLYEWIKQILEKIIDGITSLFGGSVNGGKGAPAGDGSLPSKKVSYTTSAPRSTDVYTKIIFTPDPYIPPEKRDLFHEDYSADLGNAIQNMVNKREKTRESILTRIANIQTLVNTTIEKIEKVVDSNIRDVVNGGTKTELEKVRKTIEVDGARENKFTVVNLTLLNMVNLTIEVKKSLDAFNVAIVEIRKSDLYTDKEKSAIIREIGEITKLLNEIATKAKDYKKRLGGLFIEHIKKYEKRKEEDKNTDDNKDKKNT